MNPFNIAVSQSASVGAYPLVCRTVNLEEHLAPKPGGKYGSSTVPGELCLCRYGQGCKCGGQVIHRQDSNVVTLTALVVDLDHMTDDQYAKVVAFLETQPYACILVETHTHGVEPKGAKAKPPVRMRKQDENCCRLWFPFNAPLPVSGVNWEPTWRALMDAVGFPTKGTVGVDIFVKVDDQCKDLSHCYFDPRYEPGEPEREVLVFDEGFQALDPTPHVFRGPSKPVTELLVLTEAEGHRVDSDPAKPLDHGAFRERTKGAGKSPAAKEAYRTLLAGEAFGPGAGWTDAEGAPRNRRESWLKALGVMGRVALPHEASMDLLEVIAGPSRQADIMLDGGDDSTHPWEALLAMLEPTRDEADQARAAAAETVASVARAAERERLRRAEARAKLSPEALAMSPADEVAINDTAEQDTLARKTGTQSFHTAHPNDIFDTATEGVTALNRYFYRYDSSEEAQQKRSAALVTAQGTITQSDMNYLKVALSDYKYRENNTLKPLVDFWWRSRTVTTYDRVVIKAPRGSEAEGEINVWQGFGITPKKGDSTPMRQLIFSLAGGDAAAAEYMWKWCASAVQNPDKLAYTALVLKGEEGCGKSTFSRAMRLIFGAHGKSLARKDDLLGQYTYLTSGACLLAGEELRFTPEDMGPLQDLLTNEDRTVSGKYINTFRVTNAIKLIVTTNSDFVLPSPGLMRRFLVVKCNSLHPQAPGEEGLANVAWWDNVYSWLEFDSVRNHNPKRNPQCWPGEGLRYWLYDLLQEDLSDFRIRAVPQTQAKLEERVVGQSTDVQWWVSALLAGVGVQGQRGPAHVLHQVDSHVEARPVELEAHNREWVTQRRGNSLSALSPKRIGQLMRRWGCTVKQVKGCNHYMWADLGAARKALADERRLSVDDLFDL